MSSEIKNNFVLVTGASGGVGSSICERLLIDGWTVGVCTRDRESKRIEKLESLGVSNIRVFEFDMTDYSAVDSVATDIKEWCGGKLNGLVNNAAVAHGGLIQSTKLDDVKSVFETNLFSILYLTQKMHRYLRRANGSAIINMSSIASIAPGRGQVGYGVSKAAINALTTVMANEYRTDNILVNAILPAVLDSGMASQMSADAISEQLKKMSHNDIVGVDDVTKLVLALLERRLHSQTGQLLRLDNGMLS